MRVTNQWEVHIWCQSSSAAALQVWTTGAIRNYTRGTHSVGIWVAARESGTHDWSRAQSAALRPRVLPCHGAKELLLPRDLSRWNSTPPTAAAPLPHRPTPPHSLSPRLVPSHSPIVISLLLFKVLPLSRLTPLEDEWIAKVSEAGEKSGR